MDLKLLERAIAIALEAHEGQVDKAGAPYILHPLRVMHSVAEPEQKVVAVLHDVVEDCPGWDFNVLRLERFPEWVIEALDALTRRRGETYEAFIQRAKANEIACVVKAADLADNSDMSRIPNPSDVDFARLAKYTRARAALALPQPNP